MKDFNITFDKAKEEVSKVKLKYHYIKPARKQLKSLKNIPKFKQEGIGIEIQGKDKNYIIKASGIKNEYFLNKITKFFKVYMSIYYNTYLIKNKKYSFIKSKLKLLKNIAKRIKPVEIIKDEEIYVPQIKRKVAMDKKRLNTGWARICQKEQQPNPYNLDQLKDLNFKKDPSDLNYYKEITRGKKKN